MTDEQLLEKIAYQPNKIGVLTKLKGNKALVEIYFEYDKDVRYRFKFKSVHSARNFLGVVGISKYTEKDKSKEN